MKILAEAVLEAAFVYNVETGFENWLSREQALRLQFPDTKEFKILAVDTSGAVQLNEYHQPSGIIKVRAAARVYWSVGTNVSPKEYGNAGDYAIEKLNARGYAYWKPKSFGKYKRDTVGFIDRVLLTNPQAFSVMINIYDRDPAGIIAAVPNWSNKDATSYLQSKYMIQHHI